MKMTQLTRNAAFSMVELMTVVAIIAILAAITIPAYLNYITATKLQALWKFGEPAKLYMESQYYKSNVDVSTLIVNADTKEFTTNPDSDLVKCITVQNGTISVVGNPATFNGNTFWISWTPTVALGSIKWACSYNADAKNYIESALENCTAGSEQYSADPACN